MQKQIAFILFLGISAVGLGKVATSHEGATGVIKQRMDAMTAIADGMKRVGNMLKGTAPFDRASLHRSADLISRHAQTLPELFPKGSDHKPSRSKPEVWSDWKTFAQQLEKFQSDADRFAAAAADAATAAGIREEFLALAKACKSCHKQFRLPKKE